MEHQDTSTNTQGARPGWPERVVRLQEAVKELNRMNKFRSHAHQTGLRRAKCKTRAKIISLARELFS